MESQMLILGTAKINPRYGVTRQTLAPTPENNFEDLLNSVGHLGIEALDTASPYRCAHAFIKLGSWDGPIHTKISNLEKASEELESAKKELGRELLDLVHFHDRSIAIYKCNNPHAALTLGVRSCGCGTS